MKAIQWIISALVAVVIIAAAVGGGVYFTRLKSIHSIRKLTDYENYNLYRMDIDYAYDLDRLIDRGITDNQSMINAILAEALPYLPIHMKAPNFGCSAFCTQGTDGHTLMGRNYDSRTIPPPCWSTAPPRTVTPRSPLPHWITSTPTRRTRAWPKSWQPSPHRSSAWTA